MPDVAKEAIVDPANDAEAKEEERPNSETNSPRIATSKLPGKR